MLSFGTNISEHDKYLLLFLIEQQWAQSGVSLPATILSYACRRSKDALALSDKEPIAEAFTDE